MTTFLSVIAGQDNRYEGKVLFGGKEIKSIGLDKYRRTAVSMIYQNFNLINNYSTVENILVAMDISENVKEISREKILEAVSKFFDARPGAIISNFGLTKPNFKYADTCNYGCFGRPDVDLPWERLDKVADLKAFFGL